MSASNPPAIQIEGDDLRRVPTNGSLTAIDEDAALDPEHKQDWSIVTDEKDSWANRERRRSSIFGKIEQVPASHNVHLVSTSPKQKNFVTAGGQPRRGSILSMWQGGKDKNGKDILMHDDHDASEEEEESVGSPREEDKPAERERRGSILSMWQKGKDAHGNPTIVHDDEEWKV